MCFHKVDLLANLFLFRQSQLVEVQLVAKSTKAGDIRPGVQRGDAEYLMVRDNRDMAADAADRIAE